MGFQVFIVSKLIDLFCICNVLVLVWAMIEFLFNVASVLQLVSGSLFVGAQVEWVDICKGYVYHMPLIICVGWVGRTRGLIVLLWHKPRIILLSCGSGSYI